MAGHSAASALTGGFRLAFVVGAGLVATAIVPAVVILRRPAAVAEPQAAEPANTAA
ncbi:hypothetical protein [Streptosporangium sp. NPDC002607]